MEQIKKVDDRERQDVSVEEWGGNIRLRTMNGAERSVFEEQCSKQTKRVGREVTINIKGLKVLLLSMCIVDEEDEPFLRSPEGRELLETKSGKVLDDLFKVCQDMNGLKDEDLEGMAGNSKTDRKK